MRINLKRTVAATSLAIMVLTATAMAGNNYSNYNTTVGRLNGNGYTSFQTKSTAGANGYIKSKTVGGKYLVDVRMNSASGNGSWVRKLDDQDNRSLPGNAKMKSGCSVRAQFSNDLNTPVAVQVSGQWKSN